MTDRKITLPLPPELTELDPADIKWRASSTFEREGTKFGILVAYVDARVYTVRFDKIDPEWGTRLIVDPTGKGLIRELTLLGVTRADAGELSQVSAFKGAASDSLKRCGVLFGIGRELYEVPKIVAPLKQQGKSWVPRGRPRFVDGKWRAPAGGRVLDDGPLDEDRQQARAQGSSSRRQQQPREEQAQPQQRQPPAPERAREAIEDRRRDGRTISALMQTVGRLQSKTLNVFSVRQHVRKTHEGLDDVGAVIARGTAEQRRELIEYIKGKLQEHEAQPEGTNGTSPRRAEDIPNDEALAMGAELARQAQQR